MPIPIPGASLRSSSAACLDTTFQPCSSSYIHGSNTGHNDSDEDANESSDLERTAAR